MGVQWESTFPGTLPSRLGAVTTTTSAVNRQNHLARLIPTTARMDSQIGKRDGLLPRRSGAAEFMESAAQIRARAAHQPPVGAPKYFFSLWSQCDSGVGRVPSSGARGSRCPSRGMPAMYIEAAL